MKLCGVDHMLKPTSERKNDALLSMSEIRTRNLVRDTRHAKWSNKRRLYKTAKGKMDQTLLSRRVVHSLYSPENNKNMWSIYLSTKPRSVDRRSSIQLRSIDRLRLREGSIPRPGKSSKSMSWFSSLVKSGLIPT
ncbi:hypothetical protein YC2023_017396 [Brassica napus]